MPIAVSRWPRRWRTARASDRPRLRPRAAGCRIRRDGTRPRPAGQRSRPQPAHRPAGLRGRRFRRFRAGHSWRTRPVASVGRRAGPLAWLVLDDRLRDDAPALLEACRRRGWRTLLLSGDSSPMVAQIASDLGIDQAEGGMTPAAKLARLQALQAGHRVLMLGDGVNDVPVLAAADISVAMGSATDLAKTSADAVLLSIVSAASRRPSISPGAATHHHRKPCLGKSVQWPDSAVRRSGLGHSSMGGARDVDQLAAGGTQRPAAHAPAGSSGPRLISQRTAPLAPMRRRHAINRSRNADFGLWRS